MAGNMLLVCQPPLPLLLVPAHTHTHTHCRLTTVRHSYLPYLTCLFVTENSLVCAGYDCYPELWMHDDAGKLTYINKLDQAEKKQKGHVR